MSDPLENLKQMLFKFGYKHPDEAKPFKELADERAEMQAAIVELWDMLGEARNGLKWYRDEYPQDASEADNEMLEQIDRTLENTKKWSVA